MRFRLFLLLTVTSFTALQPAAAQQTTGVSFEQASTAAFQNLTNLFYNNNANRSDGSYWNYTWPHSVGGSSRTDWIADDGTYLLVTCRSQIVTTDAAGDI
jgi:hypothetical protein